MIELNARTKEKTPYIVVCLQECERMNILTATVRKSLLDLDAGLKGQLNITDEMELLAQKIFLNQQPDLWVKYAYFSLKSLPAWYDDLLLRVGQLNEYSSEMRVPKCLWISGLFNPMSFLTSIMQVTARSGGLALDDMTLRTTVTNTRDPQEIPDNAEVGAYIHGLFTQGAAWELGRAGEQGNLMLMQAKDLCPALPVVHVTAI
jgi:dynein heavy chain